MAGLPLLGTTSLSTSLVQDGLIPLNAQSLQLKINAFGPFNVSFGGETLSLTPLSVTPNYTLYEADISRFAGQEAALRITAVDSFNPNNGLHSYLWLDSINFVVPEPSTWALLVTGAALLLVPRRNRP